MKYIKKYESIYDEVREFFVKKFIIYNLTDQYYLVESVDMNGNKIRVKKLYTLSENKITENKNYFIYEIHYLQMKKNYVYCSDNFTESYYFLNTINDTKKYNL